MKQDKQDGIKLVNINEDQLQVLVIINNNGMIINPDVNVRNWLIKEHVIKDLFGVLAGHWKC